MSIWLPSGYAPIDKAELYSRQSPRDDERRPGLLRLDVPGVDITWTLLPDKRDVRRWYAIDVLGERHAHAAWPTILRELAAGQPQALGRRRW